MKGYAVAIETLGKLGADVNITDNDDWTPVYAASDQGHIAGRFAANAGH